MSPAYDTTAHVLYGRIIPNPDGTNLRLHVLLGTRKNRLTDIDFPQKITFRNSLFLKRAVLDFFLDVLKIIFGDNFRCS